MIKEKICLGTVQFGLEYGINNQTGKPSPEDVFAMLDYAHEAGVIYLDTAAAYGNAEELIGMWIAERGCQRQHKIISKLRPNLIDDQEPDAVNLVIKQIELSLQRLQINRLNGFLLHTPANFYNPLIRKGLQEAKTAGLVDNIGVSIYEVETAMDAAGSGLIDYIQIPFNAFDQRLARSEFYRVARDHGVTVFARSPFLQGLLFMDVERVPPQLERAGEHLTEFLEIIGKHGFSRAEACMLFSALNEGHDFVVFGTETLAQLQEDLNVDVKGRNAEALVEDLERSFTKMEKAIIFPSLWAKK